ncbi:variant erythrocyte surface antigen-1 family protein [Babesia divergens]|uniref:Variant erythrocyte surface antigen-1 family protein n=1 Tax=Babesia divergens TaxID=32595 RepID=A0AAD9LKY7_BABDI|nr:variant erythrocyte surface antigen-1 family protein [Babesia divergens]
MSIIIIAILKSQSALGLYFIGLFLVYSFHCLSLHCKVRMFFISSCCLGWRIILSLSALRTFGSVLIGSLEPLRGIMVCCMYYTDVFVGSDNIVKLKNALEAELKDSGLTVDLTQLVHGLCLFMGYPSCLCKPKKSVGESLKKISKELKEELKNYKCLLKSISKPLTLNCNSCSNSVVCKCCVLDCINEVQKCKCVLGSSKNCSCSNDGTQRCCKDLLEKLKASLSLLNLKADMETLCQCTENCCVDGECTGGSSKCPFCKNLQASKDYTVAGLGLLRPSPKRLAEKLETFFGTGGPKNGCTCQCGTSGQSCCCLACPDKKCSESCNSECRSKGSSQHSQECPCKTFCQNINGIKIAAEAGVRTCCEGGQKCHCGLDPQKCQATSGLGCCIERSGGHYKHSVKCMIRRLVSYFKSLQPSSDPSKENFKNCCELMCVLKTCEFLNNFLSKNESDAQNFKNHLETLKHSSPCGQELYRTLDSFLNFIRFVFLPKVKPLEYTIKEAREKCGTCQNSSGHSSCNGCSSGSSSCPGCTAVLKELKGHKDVLSLMTRGYSSAYDSKASWTSLTSSSNSGSKCCGSSSPSCGCQSNCSSTSPSCPKECCEKCPKRLCAKIFLGFIPCLYYGLKILYDRCKDPLTWPDWKYISQGSIGKFLTALGYDLDPLKTKKGFDIFPILGILYGSDKIFENLYDFVSQNYFVPSGSSSLSSGSSKSQPSPPSTVREILLWLYGLRFTSGFSSLVSHCKDLCSPFGNSFNPDAFCYYIYTCCSLLPVSFISTVQHSDSHVSTFFSTADSEFLQFSYPEDPSDLLEKLCEYTRKIFPPLKFLCMQCELDKDQAGWRDCAFGRGCVKGLQENPVTVPATSCCSPSGSHGIFCTSVPGISNYHEHCTSSKPGVKCIGLKPCTDTPSGKSKTAKDAHTSNQCTASCPHPLLMFLIDGSESKPQAFPYSLFKLPPDSSVPPMGFSPDKLSSPGRNGESLFVILDVFVGDSDSDQKVCFLRDLLRFLLCLTRTPPSTFGEIFSFYYKLAEWVDKTGGDPKGKFKASLETEISSHPGTYSGQKLTGAVQKLYGSDHPSGNHSDPPYSLKLLSHCWGAKQKDPCGNFLFPLATNAWDFFAPSNSDAYLSWICYRAREFQTMFKDFHQKASEKFSKCCSDSSKCPKIVECPCALPFLYKYGFSFMSASRLNGKKCFDFITQLESFVENSTLDKLIEEIERFIWSIRFPFFFGFLYVWFFVLSYFFYVILIKLDTFHTGSHLHLPRSFKILPSTLFSDASSKLKDLSYFSL